MRGAARRKCDGMTPGRPHLLSRRPPGLDGKQRSAGVAQPDDLREDSAYPALPFAPRKSTESISAAPQIERFGATGWIRTRHASLRRQHLHSCHLTFRDRRGLASSLWPNFSSTNAGLTLSEMTGRARKTRILWRPVSVPAASCARDVDAGATMRPAWVSWEAERISCTDGCPKRLWPERASRTAPAWEPALQLGGCGATAAAGSLATAGRRV